MLDAASQRSILESILDGPGAPTLTAVENAIVAESLARALGTAGQPQNLREELHVRPPADGMWRCDMELHGTINGSATIVMFAAAEEEPEPPRCAPADVGEVPFEARACLEPVRITLETVQSWRAGSIMQVAGSAAAARARFIASGRLLAVGELGESAGRRALRLASAP